MVTEPVSSPMVIAFVLPEVRSDSGAVTFSSSAFTATSCSLSATGTPAADTLM